LYDALSHVSVASPLGIEFFSTSHITSMWLPNERASAALDRDIRYAMAALGWKDTRRYTDGKQKASPSHGVGLIGQPVVNHAH
jgi:hypothetical protein